MEYKLVNKEGYTVELEITLTNDEFSQYITQAYNKEKNRYQVQGFRKGKAPQYLIERVYGQGVFYDTAVDMALNAEYPKVIEELKLDVVDYPHIDLKDMDEQEGLVFTAKVDVKPELELGEYKGLEVVKVDAQVTDEDIQAALDQEVEKNSRLVSIDDRAVVDGDTVIIDYAGYLEDVAFEGGTAEKQELVIGSGTFIPGFEEQIVGHYINDEFDVNVTFPEEYHSEELKGQAVVFKVVLHEIKTKEFPQVDDEFIQDISEYDTVDEYKENTREKLLKEKQESAKNAMRAEAFNKACENAKVDIPKGMIESATDRLIQNMSMEMQYSGYTMEQYLQMTNMTIQDVRGQYAPSAKNMVVRELVLEAVIKAENIVVEEQEIEDKLEEETKLYNMSADQIKQAVGDYKKYYTDILSEQKAMDLIYESSKQVEKKEEPKEDSKEEPKEKAKKQTKTKKETKAAEKTDEKP